MKKHGKRLTKRLTAFLMSFVMVMSVMTITKPMEVQAAYMFKYSPGSPLIWTNGQGASQLHEWSSDVYCVFVKFPDNPEIYADDTRNNDFTFNYSSTSTTIKNRKTGTLTLSAGLYQVTKNGGNTKLFIKPVETWQVTYKYIDASTSTENIYRYPHYSGSSYANVPVYGNNTSASLKTLATVQGYTHGWYTQANGGSRQNSLPTSTTTLYERLIPNTYNVAFNNNKPANAPSNVTGTMSNQSFTYDTAQSLTTNQYSLEGYEFKGWNTQANGSGTSYADGAEVKNLTATNNGTVTLYAQWETLPFEITLNAGDATYPGTKTIQEKFGTGYYLNKSYTKEMTTTANKILIPKKDGYDFAGYYTGQGGSGTQIINENGYITGNYTAEAELYAHWVAKNANYTIQYHANGGTIKDAAVTSQNRTYTVSNDTFALNPVSGMFSGPVSSTGAKCGFLGWSTSPSSSAAEYADGASVGDFTNVNGATIDLYAVWEAQYPTSIQNGSFESPAIGSWYSIMSDSNNSIAWKTTASDHKIEFGRPIKNMSAANSAYHTTTVVDGYQFAELCANQVGALYQTVSTFSGNTLKWGFSHRGRSGDDTMELWIGKPADVTAVLEYYTSHNNSVAGISGDLLEKYNTISSNGARKYTDGNTAWNSYTGNYLVPDGQFETTFAFVSIAASGNKISFGNLLDNVYFTAEVPAKTQLFEYDATSGGAAVAQVNGNPTSGKEALVSVGSTFEIYPAANEGYTYNGGFVNGSYKSVDELPLRYTVSNGDTSLKHITLLFSKDSTIIFDKEGGSYADDEYDLKASGNNKYYTLKSNPTKEGYAFNNWIIAGSDVTLTEGNYIAYETDADSKTYIRVYDNSSTGRKLYECESEFGINLIATYRFTAFPSAKVVLSMDGGELDGGNGPLTYELNKFDLSDSATQSDIIEYNAMTLPTPTRGVYAFAGWKIGDRVYDADTEIKYEISVLNENGRVTIGTDTQSAITSDTTYTLTAQWETIPMEGVTASGVTKVYDGNPSGVITVSGIPAGATVTYGTTEGTYDLSTCPTYINAGVHTVYYKVSADGYTDYTSSADITVNPKPVTLNWSNTDLTYTGSEQEVTAEVSNKASDTDSFTITYNNNKKTAAGEYTATVTGLGNDNYTLTGATGVTQNWGISYLDADATVSGTLGNNDWYISDVTLTPATTGYKISANGTNWQDSLVISTEGENTVTYYLKQESTNYLTEQKSKVIKIDKTAPDGTVSISTDSWMDFWNRVTFGWFFKETQEVTVTAQDTTGGSGIDKVYYYKAATPISNASDLADVSWKSASNNKFNIEKNEKRYVYVKIEDKAGNKYYISTDGIVVYTDAAQVTKEITYTKHSSQNVDAVVALNGNTIKEVRNGDSVLTKGTDYEISSDGATITFAATYLQGLDANDYIINVSYNPGGETYVEKAGNVPPVDTTIKLSVIKAVGSVTGISDISKEYDGTGVNAPTFTTTNDRGTNGSNVTIEYRKADEDTYTTEKPKDAGSYVVRITVEADSNYKKVFAEKEFTISPKEVNATVSVADRAYNGTKTAEVTATVDTGIAGQTLTITGLTGTFDNENAGTDKTVTINSTNAVVTRGTGTNAGNYKVTYPATTTANIRAVALTVKVKDVEKHIGYEDPAFTYTITSGSLVDGETLSGISYSRDAGETAGEYNITATETSGSNSNYVLTLQTGKLTIVDHTVVTDSAVAPTCTTTGLTEGSHCSVCSKVITAQTTVPALGHDWSGEWTVINQSTDTEEGKKEKTCSREGCGVKKYEVLPKNGSTDELPANVSGTLEKNAEVAPESPIQEATLDNKKSELLNAPNIFTDGEKQQIAGGTDAKVWLEVTKTDESNIPTVDKTKVENEAKNIMGDHPTITYFDVDLFKQIAGEAKQRLHEPGINIKVTILIPSDLLNHERTIVREYKIIRLHDNDVSVLSGEFDEASKEFTFETDKFSTYAIAYSDIQLVTGITLTPDSATLTNKGETVQLTATVTPENAADKSVTWASSNTNVATVDANGKVTAVANGTCTITVTTTDGEKTATSTITVTIPSDDTGNTGDAGNTNDKKNNKPETPKTGDDSNPALWFSLLFMSLAGLAVFFARKKKDCK